MYIELNFKDRKETVEYVVKRKRVKNINIKMTSDNIVDVSASRCVPLSEIENVLRKKSKWILNVLEKNRKKNNYKLARDIDVCDNIYFLFGKKYHLKFYDDKENFNKIKIEKDNTNNTSNTNDYVSLNVEKLIYTLEYIKIDFDLKIIYILCDNVLSKEKFNDYSLKADDLSRKSKWKKEFVNFETQILIIHIRYYLEYFIRSFSKYNLNIKDIRIRTIKSYWGSCHTVKKEITLNRKLVNYDVDCLRYVIVHELAHLVHANHSKDFYNIVASVIPNYKIIRKELNGF